MTLKVIGVKQPCVLDELAMLRIARGLVPRLMVRGLDHQMAQAVAGNAARLFVCAEFEERPASAWAMLRSVGLGELAEGCWVVNG